MSNDSPDSARLDADIEVLTDYLACELPPARVAEVRQRLETDAAFQFRKASGRRCSEQVQERDPVEVECEPNLQARGGASI